LEAPSPEVAAQITVPEPETVATATDTPAPDLESPQTDPVLADTAVASAPPLEAAVPEAQIAEVTPPDTSTLWSGATDSVTLATAPALIPLPDASADTAMAAHVDLDYQPSQPEAQAPSIAQGGIILTRAPSATSADTTEQEQPQVFAAAAPTPDLQVISRLSTSDSGRVWGVSLGEFSSRSAAERGLITVKMAEASALGNGISRIRQTSGRYEALFAGLSAQEAERACLRLQARGMECVVSHP